MFFYFMLVLSHYYPCMNIVWFETCAMEERKGAEKEATLKFRVKRSSDGYLSQL